MQGIWMKEATLDDDLMKFYLDFSLALALAKYYC